MIDIFHISKLIIKKKLKVLSDSEKLQLKKFNREYPFSREIRIEELVDRIDCSSTIEKDKAWESIETKFLKSKDKLIFVLFKKTLYKYTAAAIIIGILTATFFFRDNIFNNDNETSPVIIVNDNIEVGTDKAILTLEDGSVIALEKGNAYQTQNVNSNGQQILYKADKSNSIKIAYNYLTIPRGGQFFIKLADGTQVWLNSESQLKYPVSFIANETREVELIYGEAYFEVSPSNNHNGARFVVRSEGQEVEVLGTAFNIKSYKEEAIVSTTLVEGKVLVTHGNMTNNLTPGHQSVLNRVTDKLSIATVDTYNEISWKNGIFSFKDQSLEEIMKVLSRWYDVNVVFQNEDIKQITFNGVFRKAQRLDEILNIIKNTNEVNYNINQKTITMK